MQLLKRLLFSVAVLGILTAPAGALSLSLFGSYWAPDEPDATYGAGIRFGFPLSQRWETTITGTFYGDADVVFTAGDLQFDSQVQAVPLDFGFRGRFGDSEGLAFIAGAGASFIRLKSDRGELDDASGFYALLGFEFGDEKGPRFFVEGIGRFIDDADVRTLIDDHELVTGKIGLEGYAVSVGVRWTFRHSRGH